jgi:hypothetical protein
MNDILIAAKILAAIHTGALDGLSCFSCDTDTQEQLNCTMQDSEEVVYADDDLEMEFCSCPIRYISYEAMQYYDEYQYKEIFGSMPYDYNTISSRRWAFFKEYETSLGKFRNIVSERRSKKKSPENTDNNMAVLRSQFMKK